MHRLGKFSEPNSIEAEDRADLDLSMEKRVKVVEGSVGTQSMYKHESVKARGWCI